METITCPRCGTENSSSEINCKKCQINLKFAMENPGDIERIKKLEASPSEPVHWSLIGLIVGLIPALFLGIVGSEGTLGFVGSFCLGSLGIPLTLIGAYIGKRSNKIAWIGAIVGLILGVGLIIALISTCFFCQ